MLLATLVVSGCGDGGSDATSSDGSSGAAGTGATSGSTASDDVPATPSTTDLSTGTGTGIASGGADDSTGDASASGASSETGVGPGTTGTGTGTASDAESSSSGGGGGLGPYGDCVGAMLPCPEGSFCLLVPGSGVCTPEDCTQAADCPEPPPGGDAPVTCLDANNDDVDDCRIDCSNGETCPTGMECFSDEICVWS